jgi:CDP-diacylglycerol--glycerol-3-phosphate 3-phosphatidyltransferase
MRRDFLTISNILSITRVFLVILFVIVMLVPASPSRLAGCIILALAALTDNLDGLLARKLHQETDWGRILDPLADKIGMAGVGLVLLVLGEIPLWFLTALLARDLLILLGGLYIRSRSGRILESNWAGKWTVGIVALAFFLATIGAAPGVKDILILGSTVMLALSFLMYVRRFVQVMQGTV